MRRLLSLILVLIAGCATAPVEGEYVEVLEGRTRVHCKGADLQGPFGSRLARSTMLQAVGHERSAWAEMEAIALEDGGGEGTCQNISRLWVRENGSSRVVFTQRPGWEGRNGNALEPIDWSPDGARLLVELDTWTYPTDPVDPLLLVWDARTGQTTQIEIATRLRERLGGECAFRSRGEGFSSAGGAVVRIEPVTEATNPSCVEEDQLWVVSENAAAPPERFDSAIRSWSRRGSPPPREAFLDRR